MAPVVVYTSPNCQSCHAAVLYLSRRNVPYRERNIGEDPAAAEDFGRLGYAATPIIVVDDHVLVGFNQRRLDSLLEGAAERVAGSDT